MIREELKKRVKELEEQLSDQGQQIVSLLQKIEQLEKELSLYRNRKNSSNSSLPPSSDPFRVRRTESLRESTGKKPGGQSGHKGETLEMHAEPTAVIRHEPCYCTHCGKDLLDAAPEFAGKRQVIDIPPIHPEIIEHQIYRKQCSCGHVTQGDYPAEAHSSICYGAGIQALTAYFHARQYIPYERMEELYRDLFGLSISSGTLVSLTGKFSEKASGVYAAIHDRVLHSPVVGADETGTCINGKNAWSWVFQTPDVTFIHTDSSRGKAVIEALFPDGFPRTTLVHDCWKPYFGIHTGGHQICTAHLLRELKYLDKLYPQQEWTGHFTALLHRALELKKTLLPSDYLQPVEERTAMEGQLERLLARGIDSKYEKLTVFRERMVRYRKYLFPFLYDWKIPPDNNASERAMRTFKVKLKVSGLFRSPEGANAFAVIRSVIDTTIKNAQNVLKALVLISGLPAAE